MTVLAKRVAVIGAGPIGLEAALYASQAGYTVDIYEVGRVAENMRAWKHVRLFSPFGLNVSTWGRNALANLPNPIVLPADDQLLTGREFSDAYLLPISQLPELQGHIHESSKVCNISRANSWKGDLIGEPERGDDPFRLLLKSKQGERVVEADWVLDCSGTFPHHNWVGAGGMPAIGETSVLKEIDYRLPDILGSEQKKYSRKKTLVVGSGYSAATAVVLLAQLAESYPSTCVVWITRSHQGEPISRVADDSLTERDNLAATANRLATAVNGPVDWKPGRLIESIERSETDCNYQFTLTEFKPPVNGSDTDGGDGISQREKLVVEQVIANVGYRPDRSLYEELQIHECYASGGPIKLAAALLGETSDDCLSQSSHGAETLQNPEPGFFILGAKSYGRDSRFLMKIGIEQIQDVFAMMDGR